MTCLDKNHLSVHIVAMELHLNGLPKNAIHVLGITGENGCIMKLKAVSYVDALFSHGRLFWM
jgi:hypothetical protein